MILSSKRSNTISLIKHTFLLNEKLQLVKTFIVHHVTPIDLVQTVRKSLGSIDALIQQSLHFFNSIINISRKFLNSPSTLFLAVRNLLVRVGILYAFVVAPVDLVVEFCVMFGQEH